MKVWISKYALTLGIYEVDGETSTQAPSVFVVRTGELGHKEYFHGKDWHTSHAAAVVQAEKMRQRRIKSLNESLTKLNAKRFA